MLRRTVTTAAAGAAALALALGAAAAWAAPVPAAPAPAAAGTYVVQPGDSLTAIAARHGVTLGALARTNKLDPAKPLLIGVTLRLPAKWCPAERRKVQPGDSLWTVAAAYGIGRARLAAVNGLKTDALLLLGTSLKIPARPCGEAAPSATATATATAGSTTSTTAGTAKRLPPPQVQEGPEISGTALQELAGRLAFAAKDPALAPSRTGVAVVDLRSGSTIYAQNADTLLAPASAEKVPIMLAALDLLGPRFRTRTDVLTAAPLAGGVLKGDIVLKGYGDARLTTAGVARLAAAVRALGVTTVTGSVVGDESAFDTQRGAPGWKPEFIGEESPPLSALVVDGLVGPAGPAASAAVIFTKALQSTGITVQGPSRTGAAATGARVLATIDGPPLIELVAAMGTWSDNYIAEVTLKLLGLRIAGEGSSAAGSRVVTQHLAKLGVALNGATIADGSGLSLDDRISARTLAQILAVGLRSSPNGPALRDALALGGVTGTLRRRLSTGAAAGIVRGKTGTTDLSSALAGYVGDRWAFAVISNGSPVDHWAAHALQDRVVQTLAELRR